jgi:predicted kinase
MPTLEARIGARRDDASDATVAVLRRQPELVTGRIEWLRINASPEEPERVAKAARSALDAGLGRGAG